ncbi:MAG: hypothetical protein HY744_25890 [Deltaproteobacteria bacterium]|nr:hypothetical protein [Deltaproteobacteria bacterium]
MAEKKVDPDHVDHEHLKVTGAHKSIPAPDVDIEEGGEQAIIIVTKAFGPAGDSLVGISDVTFDGYPAVTLGVRAGGKQGLVHLSPIHGDPRKEGFSDVAVGAKCELFCPVSGRPLDRVGAVEDGSGAEYFAIYLTKALSESAMVMISNVWGHYHSRIIDDMELISYWATTQDELA